jgi:ATP-dependent DNA helicase PIF1
MSGSRSRRKEQRATLASSAVLPATIDLNDEFRRVLTLLKETTDPLFVTGKAGTGKSTLLRYFMHQTGRNVVLLAPTGVAAMNIGGETLHRFFRFAPRFLNRSDIKPLEHKERRNLYRAVDILILDEVSMVRADLFDSIDTFMRLNGRNPALPFGGARIVCFGDLFQLPPIVSTDEERAYLAAHYQSEFFFDAAVFQAMPLRVEELTRVYRQQDRAFIDLLNAVRTNTLTGEQLRTLNERVSASFTPRREKPYVTLTTTNRLSEEENAKRLAHLSKRQFTYAGNLTGEFPVDSLPTDQTLHLKVGAQVMFVRNHPDRAWVNGTLGEVVGLAKDAIHIAIPEKGVFTVEPEVWEAIHYSYDPEKGEITPEVVGTFTQYPLRLAWAMTIHKSQGLTFERLILDMGRGAFAHGQTYVALSRCTSLEGIVLRQPLKPSDIRTHHRVKTFMGRQSH